MKLLALERDMPGATDGEFAPHLQAEALAIWRLMQAGVIREAYFRTDRHAAVLVLECMDVDDAQTTLNTLPLVRAELITFEIIPLTAYSGFARLFTPGINELS